MGKTTEKNTAKEISFYKMKEMASTFKALTRIVPNLFDTKFGRAYIKFEEDNISEVFNKYNREVKEIEIDNALEDKVTGAILFEDPQKTIYQYSKEGMKNRIKQENELYDLWKNRMFPVEQVTFAGDFPKEMSNLQKELFIGYVNSKN